MSDPSAKALDQIVEYVNQKRGLSLTRSDLRYGEPVLIHPNVHTLSHPTLRNTEVVVRFAGNIGLPPFELSAFYNRLHLARLFNAVSKHIPHDGETTVYQLLTKISEAVEYPITEADVYDDELAEDGTFTLRAKPLSYDVFGNVGLTVAPDVSAPWISNGNRHHLTVRGTAEAEDILELVQTTDESIYVGRFEDQDGVFHEFSDLSDLTFEGGMVYAVPMGGRDYTRLVSSYRDFPQANVYVGTSSEGLRITHEIEEIVEQGDARHRYFQAVETELATPANFMPAYRLFWLRFSHPEFNVPIHFLYPKTIQFSLTKDYLSMSNPLLDVQQTMLDEINAQAGLVLTKSDVAFENLTLVNPNVIDLTASERNSRVRIRTINSNMIDLTVNYNRLQIQRLFQARSTEFQDQGQTTLADLLPAINARLGTQMTTADIQAATINPQTKTVTLAAAAGSYGYFGTIQLSLVGEVTEPEDGELQYEGYFATSTFGGFLTEDFVTDETVSDPALPFLTSTDQAPRFATGGYNHEMLVLVDNFDVEGNSQPCSLFSSHNNGNGDWMDHGQQMGFLAYSPGAFFKGVAYFIVEVLDESGDTPYRALVRAVLEEGEGGRSYRLEPVMEYPNIFEIIVSDDHLFVVSSESNTSVFVTTDGVTFTSEIMEGFAVYSGCVKDGLFYAIGMDTMSNICMARRNAANDYTVEAAQISNFNGPSLSIYLNGAKLLPTVAGISVALWLYVYDNEGGGGLSYPVQMYLITDTFSDLQLTQDHTHLINGYQSPVTDGTIVALAGIPVPAEGGPENTNWLLVSTNGGVSFQVFNSTHDLFGTFDPTVTNFLTVRGFRIGTAGPLPPVAEYSTYELAEYPISGNSMRSNMHVFPDDSFVLRTTGTWNYDANDANGWVTSGAGPTLFFPDGRVNVFVDNQFHDSVRGMVCQDDGKIIISGSFNTYDNLYYSYGPAITTPFLVRLNADLTPDLTYNSPSVEAFGADLSSTIGTYGLARHLNDTILVSGDFNSYNGVDRIGLLRLNADGSVDETFPSPFVNYGNYAATIVTSPSGYVAYAGYSVTNQFNQTNWLMTGPDGALLTEQHNFGEFSEITYLHDFGDGKVYVFWNEGISGQHGKLSRLNADGSLDTQWQIPAMYYNAVTALPDGSLVISSASARYALTDSYLLTQDGAITKTSGWGFRFDNPIVHTGGLQSSGHLIIQGQYDWAYTKTSPFLGSVGRSNLSRWRVEDAVDNYNPAAFKTIYGHSVSEALFGGESGIEFANYQNLFFSTSHNGYGGMTARFSGAEHFEETGQATYYLVKPDGTGQYPSLDRWNLDLAFINLVGRLRDTNFQVTITIGQESQSFTLVGSEVEEGSSEGANYRLTWDADPQQMIWARMTVGDNGSDGGPIESATSFSISGTELVANYFPTATVNEYGHPTLPVTASISQNSVERLVVSMAWGAAPSGYPTWEQNQLVGETHAPSGLLPLGTDTGYPEDGSFSRSLGEPLADPMGNPIVAMRTYAYPGNVVDSVAQDIDGIEYFVYQLYDRATTNHMLDLVVGTGPWNDGSNLFDRYEFRLQFAVIEGSLPGTQTYASMIGFWDETLNEIQLIPDPNFPMIQSWVEAFSVNWQAADFSSFQLRYDMNWAIQNIPSNFWDSETSPTVKVMVSARMLDKVTEDYVAEIVCVMESIPDPAPVMRGFFVSNPMMAARTVDFSNYTEITDENAPKVASSETYAHATGKDEELVVFRTYSTTTELLLSVNAGTNWSVYRLPSRFRGVQRGTRAAYYKGSYYIQLQENIATNGDTAIYLPGLFRIVDTGIEGYTTRYELERVADFAEGSSWNGMNHTFTDDQYLYALGYEKGTFGQEYWVTLYRTEDVVTWEQFRLSGEEIELDSVKDIQRFSLKNGKLYMTGENRHPGADVGWGWGRMSYGVLDLANPGAGVTWRTDWPVLTENPLPSGWSWLAKLSSVLATDTHLVMATGHNIFEGEHEGAPYTVANEIGTIFVKPIDDLDAPWTIVNADTGIEDIALLMVEDRLLAYGKRAAERPEAPTMTYSIDAANGYAAWLTDTNEDHVFNQVADASYVAAVDGSDYTYDPVGDIPDPPTELCTDIFGGRPFDAVPSVIAQGADNSVYLYTSGQWLHQTQVYGPAKLHPWTGEGAPNASPVDTSFQARISSTQGSFTRISQANDIAVDADGRVYVAVGNGIKPWAWNGSAYAGGGSGVIRLLPNGLHDPSFNLSVLAPHANRCFINKRGRLMVYCDDQFGLANITHPDNSQPNNLIEINLDGTLSEDFGSPLVRSGGSMTWIKKIWQLSNGAYVVFVGSNSTHGVNRVIVTFSEDGGLGPTALPYTYTGSQIFEVMETDPGQVTNKVVIHGSQLNGSGGAQNSAIALADESLANPVFAAWNHPVVGTAKIGGNGSVKASPYPNEILAFQAPATDKYFTMRISTVDWSVIGQLSTNGQVAARYRGYYGPNKDIMLWNVNSVNKFVNKAWFPRRYPTYIRSGVAAVKVPPLA